jgi:hypothetical protein
MTGHRATAARKCRLRRPNERATPDPHIVDNPTIGGQADQARQQNPSSTISSHSKPTPTTAATHDINAAPPHPSRPNRPGERAVPDPHIVDNPTINGWTIRLDGEIRVAR